MNSNPCQRMDRDGICKGFKDARLHDESGWSTRLPGYSCEKKHPEKCPGYKTEAIEQKDIAPQ